MKGPRVVAATRRHVVENNDRPLVWSEAKSSFAGFVVGRQDRFVVGAWKPRLAASLNIAEIQVHRHGPVRGLRPVVLRVEVVLMSVVLLSQLVS